MNILILGANGQVGRALAARLPHATALGHAEADLEQPAALAALIDDRRPDIVINAAAYTAVDAAESDVARAHAINATAPGVIGQAAGRIGALVVHYSTDYVFNGGGEHPFTEADVPAPLSAYGESKRAGEVALAESGADHLILRVSWVYAPQGRNFPLTILRLAETRDTLSVVADQIGAPTSAAFIADITAQILPRVAAQRHLGGLYHLAPAGFVSWHGFAMALVTAARNAGRNLRLTPVHIRPIAASEYPAIARRPLNSRLDTRLIRQTFGLTLPDWQQGLAAFIAELQKEPAS